MSEKEGVFISRALIFIVAAAFILYLFETVNKNILHMSPIQNSITYKGEMVDVELEEKFPFTISVMTDGATYVEEAVDGKVRLPKGVFHILLGDGALGEAQQWQIFKLKVGIFADTKALFSLPMSSKVSAVKNGRSYRLTYTIFDSKRVGPKISLDSPQTIEIYNSDNNEILYKVRLEYGWDGLCDGSVRIKDEHLELLNAGKLQARAVITGLPFEVQAIPVTLR